MATCWGPTSGIMMADRDTLVATPTGATGILPSVTVANAIQGTDGDSVKTDCHLIRPEELGAGRTVLQGSVKTIAMSPVRAH